MLEHELYGTEFYNSYAPGSQRSAKIVVPLVCDLLRPTSVVDVGCGRGTWLVVFKEYGVNRILGIDGDYVARDALAIPPDCFRAADLNKPIELDEKFDLAVCLEVAEHISPTAGADLVKSLVQLAPLVMFSAAIPMQGGTHHINEQWPDYWAALFWRYRYRRIDAIRKLIWKNRDVEWWYRQNIFLFVREDLVTSHSGLPIPTDDADDLILIHPDVWRNHASLRGVLKRLPSAMLEAAARKIRRSKGTSST